MVTVRKQTAEQSSSDRFEVISQRTEKDAVSGEDVVVNYVERVTTKERELERKANLEEQLAKVQSILDAIDSAE